MKLQTSVAQILRIGCENRANGWVGTHSGARLRRLRLTPISAGSVRGGSSDASFRRCSSPHVCFLAFAPKWRQLQSQSGRSRMAGRQTDRSLQTPPRPGASAGPSSVFARPGCAAVVRQTLPTFGKRAPGSRIQDSGRLPRPHSGPGDWRGGNMQRKAHESLRVRLHLLWLGSAQTCHTHTFTR